MKLSRWPLVAAFGIGVASLNGCGLRPFEDSKLLWAHPFKSGASARRIGVRFLIEDGGSLSVRAYAVPDDSAEGLSGGLIIRLTRSGDALALSMLLEDGALHEKGDLPGVDASQEVALAIDVWNDEFPTRVVIRRLDSPAGPAIFDSREDPAPGQGEGQWLGFTMRKAKLRRVNVSAAPAID